jgi:GNAT superfamily N-acetyltransferase
METRKISKADFDVIVEVIDRWWGGPISTLAHPIFFYELGELAHVTVDDGQIIGFLLGFIAHEPEKTGYVHLVGIHPDFRRKGVGRKLYDSFAKACATAGCIRLKAITTPGNEVSLRFHIAQGWDVKELDDYAGPARRRVVFTKEIG